MSGSKFDPQTLAVKKGGIVEWTNKDAFRHTVTADDKSFDSGDLAAGAKFVFTFNDAGVFPYYCKIHGGAGGKGMSGTVTVQAN